MDLGALAAINGLLAVLKLHDVTWLI